MCKSLVKKQDNFACKKIKEKVSNSVLGKGISVILMVIEEEQMLQGQVSPGQMSPGKVLPG